MDVIEIHGKTFIYFYVDIGVLHLGGPEFCQGGFPINFTFEENSTPRISVTICGLPQPEVQVEFIGQNVKVTNATVNSYTYNYTLLLPQLTQKTCGKELTITATGLDDAQIADKTIIFLENCKYDYYDYMLVLNHLKNFFSDQLLENLSTERPKYNTVGFYRKFLLYNAMKERIRVLKQILVS